MKCLEMTLPMQNIFYLFYFSNDLLQNVFLFYFIIVVEMTFYKKVENDMTLFKIYTVYFR